MASVSILLGEGTGGFVKSDYIPLPRGGEVAVMYVTDDDDLDVVITQRLGSGGPDSLLAFRGLGDGTLQRSPSVVALPPMFQRNRRCRRCRNYRRRRRLC